MAVVAGRAATALIMDRWIGERCFTPCQPSRSTQGEYFQKALNSNIHAFKKSHEKNHHAAKNQNALLQSM